MRVGIGVGSCSKCNHLFRGYQGQVLMCLWRHWQNELMSAEFIEMNKLESASNIYDKFQSGVLPLQASSEDACVKLIAGVAHTFCINWSVGATHYNLHLVTPDQFSHHWQVCMIVSPQTSADKQGNSTKARNQLAGLRIHFVYLCAWKLVYDCTKSVE